MESASASDSPESQLIEKGEFMRLDPGLIKLPSGGDWREDTPRDLEALKASIAWRERRMKGSGLLVPLMVTKIQGVSYYQLEDGFRRFRAIQALIAEGLPITSVPVRVLPNPLSMSERLMLMSHGSKPLGLMEEAKVITRLEKQGLSLESMSQLMDRTLDTLKKRSILGKLTGPVAQGLREGTLFAEEVEGLINEREDLSTQQKRIEKELHLAPADTRTKTQLPAQAKPADKPSHTAWMSAKLDPTLHFVALEGLYEWMGGEYAVKSGYSKKVVEIVKLMLKYCGGKMSLSEIAEKLKKY